MTAQQELLKERQSLQEVKINKMLVEDTLGTIYKMNVLLKCTLSKLEDLQSRTKNIDINCLLKEEFNDVMQLAFMMQEETAKSEEQVDTLLTQIENSWF